MKQRKIKISPQTFKNSTQVTQTVHRMKGGKGRGREKKKFKENLRQPRRRAAATPYPDGTVVDHQLDIAKSAGLILGEHRTCDRAGRVQQQAAFVPRDQRASPQVSADEPRRPIVLVKRVPLVPQRHDVNGPTRQRGARGREARGQREDHFNPNRKGGGQRAARMSKSPSRWGARHALG